MEFHVHCITEVKAKMNSKFAIDLSLHFCNALHMKKDQHRTSKTLEQSAY